MKLPVALPTLTGRWFTAYRLLWWTLLAGALLAATVGTSLSYQRGAWLDQAFYGAGIRATAVDRRITFAPFGDETRDRFPPGSTLIAVDGREVPDRYTGSNNVEIARALGHDDGRVVRLSFRTPEGALVEVPVRRGPHHLARSDRDAPMAYASRMVLNMATNVVVSVLLMATAVMLFRRRPHDPVVALFSAGFLLVTILNTGGVGLEDLGAADWQLRLIGGLTFCIILLGIAVFPTGGFTPRWTLAILPMLAVLLTIPFWPDEMLWLAPVTTPVVALFAVAAAIWRFVKLPPGRERQQIKWATLGIGALVLLMVTGTVLGVIDRQVTDNRLHFALLVGQTVLVFLALALVCGGLLISLLRYRLYDADAAISRSATLAALTLSLIAVFAGTEKLIETLGEQWFGDSAGTAAGAIAAGLAAVLLVPMHRWLDAWAERRFQHNLVTLRKLPDLVGDLRETANIEQLAQAALDWIASTLRATGGAIVLSDGAVVARLGNGEDHPVRLPLHDETCGHVGELHLGPRPDGTLYGKDERDALSSVTGPVARAIAIVCERGETESRWQRHLNDLRESFENRMRAIEAQLLSATAAAE